jgi:hypothetical protein
MSACHIKNLISVKIFKCVTIFFFRLDTQLSGLSQITDSGLGITSTFPAIETSKFRSRPETRPVRRPPGTWWRHQSQKPVSGKKSSSVRHKSRKRFTSWQQETDVPHYRYSFEFPSYLINLLRAKDTRKENHSVTFGYAHLLMVLES